MDKWFVRFAIYNYFKVKVLDKEISRFLIVGGVAFVVNSLLLILFHGTLGMNLLLSQIIAAEMTIAVSFALHHHWTYSRYRNKPLLVRFLHFNGSAIAANAIATITLVVLANMLKVHYMAAFTIGAVLAAFWSYFANSYFIWAKSSEE